MLPSYLQHHRGRSFAKVRNRQLFCMFLQEPLWVLVLEASTGQLVLVGRGRSMLERFLYPSSRGRRMGSWEELVSTVVRWCLTYVGDELSRRQGPHGGDGITRVNCFWELEDPLRNAARFQL
jgi:hypothetical protein